jgi:hypothetical protein
MKAFVIGIAVFLVAAIAGLVVNQRRLGHELAQVRATNTDLQRELARRPSFAPEDLTRAEARLDQAQAAAEAAEERLTNALDAIARVDQQSVQREALPPNTARHNNGSSTSRFQPATRPAASSHSATGQLLNRNWGPEQVVGPANTDRAGDIPTAWASLDPDGGEEWLHVDYDRAVDISEIRIRETFNPGAISKVAALLANGQEVTIWQGTEPPAEAPVDTAFAPPSRVQAGSIKIYLDTRRVAGWNEIDAVELIGRDGSRQWGTSARASSTYAER